MKAASLAPPAGRRRRVFRVGGFSTGDVRKFQPALTLAHGTATRLNAAALRRGDRECVGQRGIAVLFVGDREL